jgi:hypothetical protein
MKLRLVGGLGLAGKHSGPGVFPFVVKFTLAGEHDKVTFT